LAWYQLARGQLTHYWPGLSFEKVDRMGIEEICEHLATMERLEEIKAEAGKNKTTPRRKR